MSAIAPPPVGAEAEPSVVSDNACALSVLRDFRRSTRARPSSRRTAARPGIARSLAALLAYGALEALVTIFSAGAELTAKVRSAKVTRALLRR